MKFTATIELTKTDVKFLSGLHFKANEGDADKYHSQIWLNENKLHEKIADKMVGIGIFQYVVSSWGYQEHEYYLSDMGRQIVIPLLKK